MKELLLKAIQDKQFELYIQLIFDVRRGRLTGGEALTRWNHPTKGLLTPAAFIDDMLACKVIDQLDFYIMEECCALLEQWSGTDLDAFNLSCNFSRISISREDFMRRFTEILDRYAFDIEHLTIEITEDALMENRRMAARNIEACKALGIRIAVDDLGAGYSSFGDLCDFPIDVIKVDRRITRNAVTRRGGALLNGIVDFAHHLDLDVLCEGAETDQELSAVLNSHTDYIQGFYYSNVCSVEEAVRRYREQERV